MSNPPEVIEQAKHTRARAVPWRQGRRRGGREALPPDDYL